MSDSKDSFEMEHTVCWHISWFNQSLQANDVWNESLHAQLSFDTKFIEISFENFMFQQK